MTPVVVLVRPDDPRNIGAAARACANFGVRNLRIVQNSISGVDTQSELTVAARGALGHLDELSSFATIGEAVADCQVAVALCGKEITETLRTFPETGESKATSSDGHRIALVFGPEPTGLLRDDYQQCTHVWHLPTQASFPSLNLGQAVAVALALHQARGTKSSWTASRRTVSTLGDQRGALHARLTNLLPRIDIPPTDVARMERQLARLLARSQPAPEELALLLTLLRKIERALPPA